MITTHFHRIIIQINSPKNKLLCDKTLKQFPHFYCCFYSFLEQIQKLEFYILAWINIVWCDGVSFEPTTWNPSRPSLKVFQKDYQERCGSNFNWKSLLVVIQILPCLMKLVYGFCELKILKCIQLLLYMPKHFHGISMAALEMKLFLNTLIEHLN